MSRARNIKPGFFRNEILVELPFEFRLLFIGLWTMADREGRMEDRPIKIKMEVFPADNVDVAAGLQALHDGGFIERYVVDSKQYIQILAWCKHQNPHVKEAKSTIPAPCEHSASPVLAEKLPERAGLIPSSLIPSSLIPDSLIPKETLASQASATEPAPLALVPDKQKPGSRFEEFWTAYPVKKGRADAEAKWKSRCLDRIADKILADVAARKAGDRQWLDGYAPHGSTYVNGRGWEDAIEPPKEKSTLRSASAGAGGATNLDYLNLVAK